MSGPDTPEHEGSDERRPDTDPHEPTSAPGSSESGEPSVGNEAEQAAGEESGTTGDTAEPRTEADFEAAFARIVADWDAPGSDRPSPGPTAERRTPPPDTGGLEDQAFHGWEPYGLDDLAPPRPQPSPPTPRPEPTRGADRSPDGVGSGWRSYEAAEEEHFVPPPPPPLPAGDLGFWGIVVGLVLGPLILVLHHGLGVGSGSWWSLLGGGLTLLGIALLIIRLPRDRNPYDPDNGAQV